MKPESLLLKILEANQHVYQFYIEVAVNVFDPEAFAPLEMETDLKLIPYEIVEQSYSQRIVFVRDEILTIETLDYIGNVLHIYVKEFGGSSFSMNFDEERIFTEIDVLYPYTIFFTKHISLLKSELHGLGMPLVESTINNKDYLTMYHLGNENEYLQIAPDTFQVLQFKHQMQYLGRYYPLTISFSDWDSKKRVIPETTKFYINSRLFKEMKISSIHYSSIFRKRNAFLAKYKNLFPPQSSFSVNDILGQ